MHPPSISYYSWSLVSLCMYDYFAVQEQTWKKMRLWHHPERRRKHSVARSAKILWNVTPGGQCPTYITFKNSNLPGFYIEHSCHLKQLYIVFFIKRQVLFFIFTTAWWVFLLFRRVLHLLFNNVSLHLHQHPLFVWSNVKPMLLQVLIKNCFRLLTKRTIFEHSIPIILMVCLPCLSWLFSWSFLFSFIFLKIQQCQMLQIVFHAYLCHNKLSGKCWDASWII